MESIGEMMMMSGKVGEDDQDGDDFEEGDLDEAMLDALEHIGNTIGAAFQSQEQSDEDGQGRNVADAMMDIAKAINRLAKAVEEKDFIQ